MVIFEEEGPLHLRIIQQQTGSPGLLLPGVINHTTTRERGPLFLKKLAMDVWHGVGPAQDGQHVFLFLVFATGL
jgi:hypothetical protein